MKFINFSKAKERNNGEVFWIHIHLTSETLLLCHCILPTKPSIALAPPWDLIRLMSRWEYNKKQAWTLGRVNGQDKYPNVYISMLMLCLSVCHFISCCPSLADSISCILKQCCHVTQPIWIAFSSSYLHLIPTVVRARLIQCGFLVDGVHPEIKSTLYVACFQSQSNSDF